MSEDSGAPAPASTNGGRRRYGKWALIGGGGCCGLILLGFIALVIFGLILGPQESSTPSASATTSSASNMPTTTTAPTTTAPAETTTEAPAPSTTPPTTEPAETTAAPAPAPTTTAAPKAAPAEDSQAWADEVEKSALMGASDWQELCGGDYSLGICWISDVSADQVGTLKVTLQLTGSDAESKSYAEGAANAIFASAGFEHEDLDWVVVQDAEGVVIDQKKRSDFPYLD